VKPFVVVEPAFVDVDVTGNRLASDVGLAAAVVGDDAAAAEDDAAGTAWLPRFVL
jgi:hypothetical protein